MSNKYEEDKNKYTEMMGRVVRNAIESDISKVSDRMPSDELRVVIESQAYLIDKLKAELAEARHEFKMLQAGTYPMLEENAALKELVREAIEIGQPEPATKNHADQMESWLTRANDATKE